MKYITITTPDNVDVEYRLAGAGARLGAVIIDTAIQTGAFITILLLTLILFFQNNIANIGNSPVQSLAATFIIIASIVIYLGYFIISEMFMNGQSLGKRVFHLRVLRENGRPVGFLQSLIRNIFRLFIDMTGIGVISIMFSKKCKRIGDMVAATIVVAESPKKINLDDLAMPNDSTENIFLQSDNLKLTDAEFHLIQDYFIRENSFSDGGKLAMDGIITYLAEKFSVPPEKLNRGLILKIVYLNRGQG